MIEVLRRIERQRKPESRTLNFSTNSLDSLLTESEHPQNHKDHLIASKVRTLLKFQERLRNRVQRLRRNQFLNALKTFCSKLSNEMQKKKRNLTCSDLQIVRKCEYSSLLTATKTIEVLGSQGSATDRRGSSKEENGKSEQRERSFT